MRDFRPSSAPSAVMVHGVASKHILGYNSSLMTTFVCCVESGGLESQTIRMVRSLRQHGGRVADAPIIAVTPRFGPPLSKNTTQVFNRLNVTHIRRAGNNPHPWFKFLNKPLALIAAE